MLCLITKTSCLQSLQIHSTSQLPALINIIESKIELVTNLANLHFSYVVRKNM
jgi:hypothetical protein